MICVSESASQKLTKSFVVLRRDTTWKCGTVERLIVNYLRRQIQRFGCDHFSVKDMLEHFKVKKKQHRRFLEAIERLEKRGIIQIVFDPFSSPKEVDA